MPKNHFKTAFQLACASVLLIYAVFPAARAQTSTEETKVRKAVERFYSYFSQHKYDRMWTMLSRGLKEGNENNKSRYVKELNKGRLLSMRIEITAVKIDGSRATVTVVMRIQSNAAPDAQAKTEEETHEVIWVKEKGKWLFDGSRLLSEDSSPSWQVAWSRHT
jgi:hypothetical protein